MRLILPGDGWIRAGAILAAIAVTAASQAAAGIWCAAFGALAYFLVRGAGRFFRERAFLQAEIRRMQGIARRDIPTDL